MNEDCQRYIEDPEANAAHLRTCAKCNAEAMALAEKADLEPPSIDLNALQLAPWEGSSHRAWPLVLGTAAVVAIVALALLDAAGMSPLHVVEGSLTSMEALRTQLNRAASSLRSASLGAQVAFGVAFLVVNGLLIAQLRRAPRGIDA
ncbi:MAG: hypothetical protein QOE68_1802 [Thermoanaerobaculia bacterium]|nr:hypothetical protein [Thermoanaerobaculia bacterium]